MKKGFIIFSLFVLNNKIELIKNGTKAKKIFHNIYKKEVFLKIARNGE